MSERSFRLVLGITLWILLVYSAYFETMTPIYAFIGFLVIDSLSPWRVTMVLNKLRFGDFTPKDSSCNAIADAGFMQKVDSERVLRLIIATFVIGSYYILPELLWFLPWFVAGMLIMAGITNICPMAMLLKWTGMR